MHVQIDVTALLEAFPDGAVIAGPEGTVRAANHRAEIVLARSASELVGQLLSDVLGQRAAPEGAAATDRDPRWHVTAIRDASGLLLGALALVDAEDTRLRQRCD